MGTPKARSRIRLFFVRYLDPTKDARCDLSWQLACTSHEIDSSSRESRIAQQGLDWKLMIKMFGHSDFELILRVYYAQNDDASKPHSSH